MGEVETLVAVGACAVDDSGDAMAIFERGHVPPWNLRRVFVEEWDPDEPLWPTREWWREVPWSIMYPDDPPCDGGEESIVLDPCRRSDVGAFPVTVIHF